MSALRGLARGGFDATLSDTVDLPQQAEGIYIHTAGTVRMLTADGDLLTRGFVAGATFPVRIRRVYATGTTLTATDITCLRAPY